MDPSLSPRPAIPPDWPDRFAYRLRRQWPTVDQDDLRDLARALQGDPALAQLPPEDAAAAWLRRGVLAGAEGGARTA